MIRFENDGEINPRSITTFGVNSKDNDSAIGFFGTGLKYAIAVLLREGCSITIYSGGNKYEFDTDKLVLRNSEFSIIRMNGQDLGFTTELGKTWEMWQAYRELYCNCKDERGEVVEVVETTGLFSSFSKVDSRNKTIIDVKGSEFEKAHRSRHTFILQTKPIYTTDSFEIHEGTSKKLFYKGIAIYDLNKPSKYTYNIIKEVPITEDRILKDYWNFQICMFGSEATKIKNQDILKTIFYAPDNFFEYGVPYSGPVGEEFNQMCKAAARNFDTKLNPQSKKLYSGWLMEAIDQNPCEMTPVQKKMLEKGKLFIKNIIGHDVDEYQISVSEVLGDNVLGLAYNNQIYLSKRTFMQGTKQVTVTLLEEYLHLKFKLEDETYSMQNFLFDMIGDLGEQLQGEPL